MAKHRYVFRVNGSNDGIFDLGEHHFVRVAAQNHVHMLIALEFQNVNDLDIALVLKQAIYKRFASHEVIDGAVRHRQRRELGRKPRTPYAWVEHTATSHKAVNPIVQ